MHKGPPFDGPLYYVVLSVGQEILRKSFLKSAKIIEGFVSLDFYLIFFRFLAFRQFQTSFSQFLGGLLKLGVKRLDGCFETVRSVAFHAEVELDLWLGA